MIEYWLRIRSFDERRIRVVTDNAHALEEKYVILPSRKYPVSYSI